MHGTRKAILPGIILGTLAIIFLTGWITRPQPVLASTAEPAAALPQAASSACSLSAAFPSSVLQWCSLIENQARVNNVEPKLVAAVILQESKGNPQAYSKSGAVGLMQVMPRDGLAASFMCINGPCFADRPSMSELYEPAFNISYGTRMLASLIQRHGSVREALRAYGPRDVGYYYADIVLQIYNTH